MAADVKSYGVVMPKLGLIMTQARVVEWRKSEGEWVEKGEVLYTLESEKSILGMEAPISGYVHILVAADTPVAVQTPIAVITPEPANDVDMETTPVEEKKDVLESAGQSGTPVQMPGKRRDSVGATPRARVMARRQGLALEGLAGSGPRKMIVAADLEKAAAATGLIKVTPVARRMAAAEGLDLSTISGTGPRRQITRQDVERAVDEAGALTQIPAARKGEVKPLPLTGLRAVIAERLVAGWQERPQVTLVADVDAANLVSTRRQIKDEYGTKVSYNSILVLAVSRALRELPDVNVSLVEDGLIHLDEINVGVAVDTARGLLVPVVKNSDQKGLFELDHEIRRLAQSAIDGQSTIDELTGGTFTITNLGTFGIDAFTPIINPPEAAILGVGKISPQAVVVNGNLAVRETVTLSLSFDHRLMDGAPAARFLQRVGQLLERPLVLLSNPGVKIT